MQCHLEEVADWQTITLLSSPDSSDWALRLKPQTLWTSTHTSADSTPLTPLIQKLAKLAEVKLSLPRSLTYNPPELHPINLIPLRSLEKRILSSVCNCSHRTCLSSK